MTMCEVMERLTLHPLVDSGSDLVLSAFGWRHSAHAPNFG